MSSLRLIYCTTPGLDLARRIGRQLVAEGLAACTNALPGMHSCYWWQGELCEGEEAVLIAKTRTDLVDKLVERLRELHPDSVPCALALAVEGGNADFIAWLQSELRERSD